MSRIGPAILLASCLGGRGLHVGNATERSAAPHASNSTQVAMTWHEALKYYGMAARTSCHAGLAFECLRMSQKLQDHVWEELRIEAAKLGVEAERLVIAPLFSNGCHMSLPACSNGTDAEVPPELVFRHIPKIAGYNVMVNLHRFAGGDGIKPNLNYDVLRQSKAAHPNSTFVFTFSRDPISRFISGYTELEVIEQPGIDRFERGSQARALEFVRGVLRGYHKYHIVPQVSFHVHHYQHAGGPFDYVGRLEEFQKEWDYLQKLTNCTGKLPPWDRERGKHESQNDPFNTTKAMKGFMRDPHPESWRALNVNPREGLEDALSLVAGGREEQASRDGLAMRDMLLWPDKSALRALCLFYLADFHIFQYRLPDGCEDLDE